MTNYIEYKKRLGYSIAFAEIDEELTKIGQRFIADGKTGTERNKILRILDARKLSDTELRFLIERQAKGTKPSQDEFAQLERARFESFFRREVFADLIELEERVDLANKVRMFELLSTGRVDGSVRETEAIAPTPMSRALFLGQAFKAAGIYSESGFLGDTHITDDDLNGFRGFMEANRAFYEAQFGRSPRKDLATSPMRQLTDLLEWCRLRTEKVATKTVEGRKKYHYRLDAQRLSGLKKLQRIRKAVPTDWPAIDGFEN
ncbi:hypothetical protein [Rhizobium sp. GN54]|uniref:hypothetical protein n=1 Tax=Rhizobium sp. GN54 TaxID=2898150 RepID=UPI001E435C08|nr:hypothetical protein [Rhizobium sp. GN54]MCD2185205.1 hypothetical protein [Rhizobium sp. GN54]